MKIRIRGFVSLALATVAASLASAAGSSTAYGYASASFSSSSSGVYFFTAGFPLLSGNYGFHGSYGFGGTYQFGVDYASASQMEAYVDVSGYTDTWAAPGGSTAYYNQYAELETFISNPTSSYAVATVDVFTTGGGSSYADSWDDYGSSLGQGWVYFVGFGSQYSNDYTSYGPATWETWNGDLFGNSSHSSFLGANMYPGSISSSTYDSVMYTIGLQPGAFLEVDLYAGESSWAGSVTPGPAAVAPFAASLLSLLCRRRRLSGRRRRTGPEHTG